MSNAPALRTPRYVRLADDPGIAQRLQRQWETAPGLWGWLCSVDHKQIGLRYIVTSFLFLLAGGIEAAVIRLQLARPDQHLLTPEQYNQLFTMHGVTMIFLYALPVLSGFSNFLWPLILGSRDMAFPRLNALSYWVFLAAGLFLYASFPLGRAPDAGWFNYVPYSSLDYNPGINIDVYALGMLLLGISTTVGSINFIVSLLRTRAPGMSINRVPILVWGTLTASVGNLLAVPAVSLAFLMLWMDRQFGTHFFDPTGGGQPLLWQHLFWMFGHPWVYAIVLPAMGIVSDGLPTFCRRPLVGYTAVALATVTTMVLGFGVWVHHMFATGLPPVSLSFFSAASFAIVIPSAVAGGIYYWFPKFTGRMMNERLGHWSFWVMFIGFNVGFFPMHLLGLLGMPRRIYTYGAGMGWGPINLVVSAGAYVFAVGVLLLLVNVVRSLRHGLAAGPNPWDAPTLEWSTPSPPPPYNFLVIPTVASRNPLWEDRMDDREQRSILDAGLLLDQGRETLGSTALDAEPDVILRMPGDSPAPLLLAIALCGVFGALLVHRWWVSGGFALLMGLAILVWLWPERELGQTPEVAYA
jgi:heme/copper-type cytochrome/quinol oxidase subunit 1